MRRRKGDGCPVAGALQVVGDKWTLLVVRDLASAPRRTTELIAALHPISSRTLVGRLRDMERDRLVERRDYGGSPPHVEYALTERGRLLLPLLESLRQLGLSLGCNECEDRRAALGDYCDACPRNESREPPNAAPRPARQRERDDSIVLL
ncbi:MAG TPA: helix-turn-helix domain-containing protein [Pyrinomonadaceae bacterium]|jgi:DNA-binding HxlR family transcriptional regulator